MTPRLLPMEVRAMPKQAIFEFNLKYLKTDGPGALRTETSATLLVPAGWQLLAEQIGKRSKKWCSPHKLKSGLSKVNVIVSNASDMAEMIVGNCLVCSKRVLPGLTAHDIVVLVRMGSKQFGVAVHAGSVMAQGRKCCLLVPVNTQSYINHLAPICGHDDRSVKTDAVSETLSSISEDLVTPPIPQVSTPVGPPYVASSEYLSECSLELVESLVRSWNFEHSSCCAWHSGMQRLTALTQQMWHWHKCSANWTPDVSWQCDYCSALHAECQPDNYCWICSAQREEACGAL